MSRTLSSVGLFCASTDRLPAATLALAADFGRACAARGVRLVYGGGARGLMGVAARAAHEAGGAVEGYMLEALIGREGANVAIGELRMVATLAERKRRIAEAADAFVALPGGIGTLDELTEVLTLDDIGLAAKPVCLLDADGFWAPFRAMLDAFSDYGVMRPGIRRDLLEAHDGAAALDVCVAALERANAARRAA
jgi:uncharacterized protein (TIGR00730 family)